uniref:Uncharacterized protein AlNc14C3G375 n=1 Tax=Albugo laibachii Nc14 TaxID=890382 RepID=F0VZP6_9STRA|nr:conserved hypothetical protein [Albugo laibachii Nc14]|eukprot:CCA14267.1 conserved hypothetical protein [Albugo laibachii Nc14]
MDLSPSDRVNSVRELVFISEDTDGADTTNLSLWHAQVLLNQPSATKESSLPNPDNIEAVDERVEEAFMTSESDSERKHVRTQINNRRTMWNRQRQKEKLEDLWKVAAISYNEDSNLRNDMERNSVCHSSRSQEEQKEQPINSNGCLRRNLGTEVISFTPESKVSIIYEKYRCVFCLDFSPSTFSVDPNTGKVFSDSTCELIEIFLRDLTTKMMIGDLLFQPEIHLSILLQNIDPESLYVLIQGFALSTDNQHHLLGIIQDRLKLIENFWAFKMRNDLVGRNRKVDDELASRKTTMTSLSQTIRNAVYALNSLPKEAASFLVIITDGVVDQFDAYSYDGLLMQLVRHDINCHFIQLGGSEAPNQCFGYVRDTEFLRFLAKATGGNYWSLDALLQTSSRSDNCMVSKRSPSDLMRVSQIQDACLIRKSSLWRLTEPDFQIQRSHYMLSCDAKFLIPLKSYRLWREKVHDYRIVVDMDRIIEVRTREGFRISKLLPDQIDAEIHDPGISTSRREHGAEITRYIVFVLQWKQDVWIEYVISITKEASNPDQRIEATALPSYHEWYVKINIVAQVEFLHAFENCKNKSVGFKEGNESSKLNDSVIPGTPLSLHHFLRNVQDVDRVLLHLVTATVSSYITKSKEEGERSYYGFGTPSDMMPSRPHPVFGIIGNLSPVLWHRWFAVDRFEILQIIPNDMFIKSMYGSQNFSKTRNTGELENSHQFGRILAKNYPVSDQSFPNHKEPSPFKGSTPMPEPAINDVLHLLGTIQMNERVVSVITKWSSQRLAQDLFLKFLQPLPHRPSKLTSLHKQYVIVAQGDRLCGKVSHIDSNERMYSKTSRRKSPEQPFCIVRIERKNHVLTAFHVAFFSARPSLRKQTVSILKQSILAEINDAKSSLLAWHPSFQTIASSPSGGTITGGAAITKAAVACHRMISRLTAGLDILALYNEEQAKNKGPESCLPLNKQAGSAHPSCCGGSDIALRETFGSYMWHINWRWEFANSTELVKMMKHIHKSRIAAGFWVLDWHLRQRKDQIPHGKSRQAKSYNMAAADFGGRYQKYRNNATNFNNHDVNPPIWSKHRIQSALFNVESVTFGREILLEDKNGREQCILLQYGMLRVSETRLITSFWMEPHHGVMKPIIQDDFYRELHKNLDHAVGHERPMQKHQGILSLIVCVPTKSQEEPSNDYSTQGSHIQEKEADTKNIAARQSQAKTQSQMDISDKVSATSSVYGINPEIPKQEVNRAIHDAGQLYLCENDLLQLVTAFLFHCDRQVVASHHTFSILRSALRGVDALPQPNLKYRKIVGGEKSANQTEGTADSSNLLIPPFSTARLLSVSNRVTDQFLMYLEHENLVAELDSLEVDHVNEIVTHESGPTKPPMSSSNLHLYTMLKETLQSLSDFEVTWTDINGELVTKTFRAEDEKGLSVNRSERSIPLWITSHLSSSAFLEEWIPQYQLSQGRCFGKLINKHDILLSFLPSLEVMETRQKPKYSPADLSGGATTNRNEGNCAQSILSAVGAERKRSYKLRDWDNTYIQKTKKSTCGSSSSDDIVLYWQRRQSFREDYQSCQNNRHTCQYHQQPPNLKETPSTTKDHELCRNFSRESLYGADSHLLLRTKDEKFSTGFFQVAFYEIARKSLSYEPYQIDRRKIQEAAKDDENQATIYSQILPNIFTIIDRPPKEDKNKKKDYKFRSEHRQGNAPAGSGDRKDFLQSSAARQFREKMKRAHEHNFSRGVYISLREGTLVQQSDLMQAISSCLRFPLDIDITVLHRTLQATSTRPELFQLQNTYQKHHTTGVWDELMKRFKESFIQILLSDHLFKSICGTEYYVFVGNESIFEAEKVGQEDNVTQDNDDNGSDLCSLVQTDVLDTSQQYNESMSVSEDGTEDGVEHDHLQAQMNDKAHSSEIARDGQTENWNSDTMFRGDYSTRIQDGRQKKKEAVDLELNKDVAVATSNLSMPFFLRFEYVEVDTTTLKKESLLGESGLDKRYFRNVERPRPLFHRSHSTHSLIQPSIEEKRAVSNSSKALADQKTLQHGSLSEVVEWFEATSCSRIALRLITITLPNEELFDRYSNRRGNFQSVSADATSKLSQEDATKSQEIFGALPVFQRQVIKKLRQQMKEWCGVEILSILRTTHCITVPIAQLVSKLLQNLPHHLVTKVTYRLRFTTDIHESSETAQEIFARVFVQGNSYFDLFQCNDLHFVVRKNPESSPSSVSSETITEGADVNAKFTIPYWAYFFIRKGFVHMYMHSPKDSAIQPDLTSGKESFNKLLELTRLRLGVQCVCKRVNQILLLSQLHESRTCNVLLLSKPRVSAERNTTMGSGVSSSQNVSSTQKTHSAATTTNQHGNAELSRQRANTTFSDYMEEQNPSLDSDSFFWPGQFECPLQYSAFFKLHDRLAPNVALNMLCTSALEQFQVHNRRHLFVYRDRTGHVFYLKISVSETTSEAKEGRTQTKLNRLNRISPESTHIAPDSSNAGAVEPTMMKENGILLQVFGISDAGEEVTHELCRLFERKLDEATLLILMKLLGRNAKFQLSMADLSFLCPPMEEPHHVLWLGLPLDAQHAPTLMHIIGKVLCNVPYVRHVTNSGTISSGKGCSTERRHSRTRSRKLSEIFVSAPQSENCTNSHHKIPGNIPRKSEITHPAYLPPGELSENARALLAIKKVHDVSPVYLSYFEHQSSTHKQEKNDSSEAASDTMFVINLNPELRIAPPSFWKIGKGLIMLKIGMHDRDKSNHNVAETPDIDYLPHPMQDIDAPQHVKRRKRDESTLIIRMSLWARGNFDLEEVDKHLKNALQQAICDYYIQHSMCALRRPCLEHSAIKPDNLKVDAATLIEARKVEIEFSLMDMDYRKSLLDVSSRLRSMSTTEFRCKLPISADEIEYVVDEFAQLLENTLPIRFSPLIVSKLPSQKSFTVHSFESAAHEVWGDKGIRIFRIIPSGIVGTGSDVRPVISASNKSSSCTATLKKLAESEILMYTSSEHTNRFSQSTEDQKSLDNVDLFYYILEFSSNEGFRLFGYNISTALIELLLLHSSRILTWSSLRRTLSCSLSMVMCGLLWASPSGTRVIQPRELYINGGTKFVTPVTPKKIAVDYIELGRTVSNFVGQFRMQPALIDTSYLHLLESTSLGRYLREFGGIPSCNLSSTSSDLFDQSTIISRPRTKSNVSRQSSGTASCSAAIIGDLKRESSYQSLSQWSTSSELPSPMRSVALDYAEAPSPTKTTKTTSLGLNDNQVDIRLISSTPLPRTRENSIAANALLAARVRARGGTTSGSLSVSHSSRQRPCSTTVGIASSAGAPPSSGVKRVAVPPKQGGPIDSSGTSLRSPVAISESSVSQGHPSVSGQIRHYSIANPHLSSAENAISFHYRARSHARPPQSTNSVKSHSSEYTRTIDEGSWPIELKCVWGPQYRIKQSRSHANEELKVRTQSLDSSIKYIDSLRYTSERLNNQWAQYETQLSHYMTQLSLFNQLRIETEDQEGYTSGSRLLLECEHEYQYSSMTSNEIVESLMTAGHTLIQQRYHIVLDDCGTSKKPDVTRKASDNQIESLQMALQFVNLLSYKEEMIFTKEETSISQLHKEQTIKEISGDEGQHLLELRKRVSEDVNRLQTHSTEVFRREFLEQLLSFGFRQLQTAPLSTESSMYCSSASSTGVKSESDQFTAENAPQYFYYVYHPLYNNDHKDTQFSSQDTGRLDNGPQILLVLLKVRHANQFLDLNSVILFESDLHQLAPGIPYISETDLESLSGIGEIVDTAIKRIQTSLEVRTMIFECCLRCLSDFVYRFINMRHQSGGKTCWQSLIPFQNVIRSIRAVNNHFHSLAEHGKHACSTGENKRLISNESSSMLRSTMMQVSAHGLCSNNAIVNATLLLRYMASHPTRYGVSDLFHCGTPDTICCQSSTGTFTSSPLSTNATGSHDQNPSQAKNIAKSSNTLDTEFGDPVNMFGGYTLLMTLQEVSTQESDKNEQNVDPLEENCIQLFLLRTCPVNGYLDCDIMTMERAMEEAKQFVAEAFKLAGQHYERDLLWTRLLYHGNLNLTQDIAATYGLPIQTFQHEVGSQELDDCLRLSACTSIDNIEPQLRDMFLMPAVDWRKFIRHLHKMYAENELREYRFSEDSSTHLLLLCLDAGDLMIHLRVDGGQSRCTGTNQLELKEQIVTPIRVEICQREESSDQSFTASQRHAISKFVNLTVHWLWSLLLYD